MSGSDELYKLVKIENGQKGISIFHESTNMLLSYTSFTGARQHVLLHFLLRRKILIFGRRVAIHKSDTVNDLCTQHLTS